MSTLYKIVRMYERPSVLPRLIRRGLTLDQARAHCRHPETSSRTATAPEAKKHTEENGPWFDGFDLDR